MFDLKKYRGVIFHDNEEWCKICRKTDFWFGKWHEEYSKFSPEQLEVSKLAYWWDTLNQSRKSVSLKSTEKLCVMTIRMTQNLKRNWLVILKLTRGNWWILTRALESLKNFHFYELLLSKVYIVWTKKVQRRCLSWNWRGIQNLERDQLVI